MDARVARGRRNVRIAFVLQKQLSHDDLDARIEHGHVQRRLTMLVLRINFRA